ncbi:hypothetical protein X777_15827 [Ooceraea biroi]|uniref:Uncharacterized protein n=1 Tax=Ooceraea biroi TaxID=2015173 RepID=A0A026WT06_OOCBI|nr:hypothetical protein X777_15827 [Ooceraea biroi]
MPFSGGLPLRHRPFGRDYGVTVRAEYERPDPFSGLKGSRTCFDQSFLHGSLVKVRRRIPFRD